MKIKLFLFFVILTNCLAQTDSITTKFGIYGGINLNSHTADFYKLAGIPNCCPNFESGDGIGYNAGLLLEYKLSNNLWLGGRLGVMTLDGELIKEEPTTIILDTGPADGKFEHKMTGSFINAGFEPSIIYNPFAGLQLSAGARFGINLTKNFDQVEAITDPAGYGTFLDSLGNDTHKRTRNEYSGEIPDAIPFQMFLHGGISYELPLNSEGSLLITPELSYYFPLAEMVENSDWKVSSLRAGIALKYAPIPKPPKEEIFRREMLIDTVKIESDHIAESTFIAGNENMTASVKEAEREIITTESITRTDTIYYPKEYALDGNIRAVGVDSTGKEIDIPVFVIEEYISNRLYPLLNYVFFEDNSSDLPHRYKRLSQGQADNFEINSLYEEQTLEIYYNILNIIGKRLEDIPDAELTITGCNSDLADEKANKGLSEQRALTVRDYIINVWNIQPNRLKIEFRNLPLKPSVPLDEPVKAQENRRVELSSNNDKILEPIFIEKVDRKANPPIVRFKPQITSDAGLNDWEILSYQNSSAHLKFVDKGTKTIPDYIDWQLADFQKIIPRNPEPISFSMKFSDVKGNRQEITNRTLPIDIITIKEKRSNRIGDYEIEKFSLILFDFDKSTIEGNNKKTIAFISSRIKPESEIIISGYTDTTGDDDYNLKLSNQRSNSTKKALGQKDAKSQGFGEQTLLYDNELPEGRFYCRTVEIEVKTKVK